jgi:hypothetical protein
VDDTDSEDGHSSVGSTLSIISLEEAVQQNPSRAVEKVAAVLGLVEENFLTFKRRALEFERKPQLIEKRPHLQQDQTRQDTKRQRLQVRSSPQLPKPAFTPSQLLQDSTSESTKSEESKLEYEDMSTTIRQREKNRKLLVGQPRSRTPSTTYPDGSPTIPNESPRVEEAILSGSKQPSSRGSQTSGERARKGR